MNKILSVLAILFIIAAVGCSRGEKVKSAQKALSEKAENINSDFRKIRMAADTLAAEITHLYETSDQILPRIDKSKYRFASNGIFMKTHDDGGSAIFVSGYYPITEEVRQIVYFTEPIDSSFKRLIRNHPEIVQLYYNDNHSINRIYPFFDVLSQYEAKMDIPSFNFYYLADEKHNPGKKSLWLSEAYVDPAGRGYMVSAIAPVYYKGMLVGVPGIDVTINRITKRYIDENPECMTMIIDNNGAIVAAQESAINFLSFPPLFEHKYVETIKQDTYRKETYNLSLSKDANVRSIANEILKYKKPVVETKFNNEDITLISSYIQEMNWYLVEIIK